MRNGFVKLACILTMLALLLTGCSLIEIDPVMQADEDMQAINEELAKVIVEYDGGVLTKGDLMADVMYQYSYLYYMYMAYYGMEVSDSETQELVEYVASGYMNTAAIVAKAAEMGVVLSEEEIAECVAYAETSYQSEYDATYAETEAETEELRDMYTRMELANQGLTYDYYYRQKEWDMLLTKMEELICADAPTLTEEELEAALAEQALEDEQTYSSDAASFEQNIMDETVCITWMPSGYRTVKHILLIPSDEVLNAYTDAESAVDTANSELVTLNNERLDIKNEEAGEDARAIEDVEADIEAKNAEIAELEAAVEAAKAACIADVQDKLDEIYARLEDGEDFEALMAEYGEDPGMQSEPTMTDGYYVSATSESWDFNFRNGAMDLEKVGDYSAEPVVGASGVHIIYYNSDVTEGPVALDDVRDQFTEIAQSEADALYFDNYVQEWVAELNPVYHIDEFFVEE